MSGDGFSSREARARKVFRALTEHERERGSSPEAPALHKLPDFSRYEIRGSIGEGASAVVYRAWDRELNRPVALKLLRESAGVAEVGRQRFRREAQAAAGLSHPNLVHVYDAGEQDGRLFLVLELVEGRPLSQVLAERTHEERDLVRLLERVARGIEAAHAGGIIHRDLKPENILVAPPLEPKVGDFGLAHLMNSETMLTRTGSTLGTPLYMSPEQVEGRPEDITPRTDVYALGAILYEILTGRPPHTGETAPEIYRKIVVSDPVPPRRINGKASVDLETIALKALQKHPDDRFPTAAAFAEDLRRHLEGESIEARPVPLSVRLWRRALRQRLAVAVFLGALMLGSALGVFWRRPDAGARPAARIEKIEGEVHLLDPERRPAAVGTLLAPGQAIRTGGGASAAFLSFPDRSRLEMKPDTWIRELVERATTSQGKDEPVKHLFMVQGRLRLELEEQSAGPMSLATPHAQIEVRKATFDLTVDSLRTWIEVAEGEAILTRMRDGARVRVTGRNYAIAAPVGGLAAVPAEEGLIGYWFLDEASGTRAADSSGRGHDARMTGPIEWVEGRRGKGLRFKGGGGVLDVPTLSLDRFPSSGTLSFWIKGDFSAQPLQRVFEQWAGNYNMVAIAVSPASSGLEVTFRARPSPNVFKGSISLKGDQWHHVAVVWDTVRGLGALYRDGHAEYASPLERSWEPRGRFMFGAQEPKLGFAGVLDEIAIFDKPLTEEAVWRLSHR